MKSYAALLALAMPFAALADQNSFSIDNPSQNSAAGQVTNISGSYNSNTKDFKFYATFVKPSGATSLGTDGFHLVVSPGPNPKGFADELAIIYFDGSDAGNPKLNVFSYNGQNANNSWQTPGDKIKSSLVDSSFIKDITFKNNSDGSRTLGFDIDATDIQSHNPSKNWTGVSFGQSLGMWFHPYVGTKAGYRDGYICNLDQDIQGWVDLSNVPTVPEPTSMIALGMGAAALLRKRNKK